MTTLFELARLDAVEACSCGEHHHFFELVRGHWQLRPSRVDEEGEPLVFCDTPTVPSPPLVIIKVMSKGDE